MRFSKYNYNWIIAHLDDVANVVGGGTPDTSISSYWNGNIQFFTPTEIGHSKYVTFSKQTISKQGLLKSNAKMLPKGTILLSSRATIGECSITLVECATNQGFQNLIAKQNIYNEFLYYMVQTKRKHFIKYACGSTFLEISNNEIKKTKCSIPCIEEQKDIASLLTKIDERIETQSKIIKEYKLLKNAITNQLIFHSKKMDKHIILKNFATLKNGYAFKSESYADNGDFNIITIANVQGNKYIDTTQCNKINKIPNDIQPHQILKNNDILISLTGNVGRVSLVNTSNCLLNQRVGVLNFINEKFKKYIYQVISNKKFERTMILCGQGAAQKNIGNDDIESFLIPLSDNLEYINKIVNLLDNLDKKIAIEEHIINDYLSQKKYMLCNMFI